MADLNDIEQALANVIQARRKSRKMSQERAVSRLQEPVTVRTLSHCENGRQQLTVRRLVDLAQAYGESAPGMLAEALRRAAADSDGEQQ